MARLQNLPTEVVLHIGSYLRPKYTPGKKLLHNFNNDRLIQRELHGQRQALVSLTRTSHRHYKLFTSFLYESVSVHSGLKAPRQWLSLMKTLSQNEDLCRLVKQLYIHLDGEHTLSSTDVADYEYVTDLVTLEAWLKKASWPDAMYSFNVFELSSAVLFTLVNNAQDLILSAEPLSLSEILDAIHDMNEILSTQQTNKSTLSSLESISMRKEYTDAESHWAWPRERLFNARFIDGAKSLKETYIVGTALQFHNWSSTNLTTLAFNDSSMPLPILANAIRACPRLERFFWKKPIRRDMHPYAVHPWLILGALGIRRATLRTLVIDFNGTCETDLQSPAFELSAFTRLEAAWVDISVFKSNKANFTDANSDPLNPTVVEGSPLIRTLPPSLRKLHISGAMNDFNFDEVLWLARPNNREPRHIPAELALDGGYLDGDMFKLWDYRNDYEHIPTADLDPQPFLW
ncbi:hypothetical protein CaCOL14_011019 [Colletotrichum acutatum]|uniref:Uncharacterized protein n=1 Tax=Glomerella acutata TaxID=27357 RepID=A0AAD8UAF9_GLOAC|nr:uncharacterized protein BDZ83DRAFT_797734 [Colletotrichum acutatum]KAK1706963.1 hypothetical protein BDZ83DRAFT_797734 [Colletotrichum acutatum]